MGLPGLATLRDDNINFFEFTYLGNAGHQRTTSRGIYKPVKA